MTKLDQTIRHKCLNVHFQHLFRMYLCHPVRSKDLQSGRNKAGSCNKVYQASFRKS
jgi:hypothetical protein